MSIKPDLVIVAIVALIVIAAGMVAGSIALAQTTSPSGVMTNFGDYTPNLIGSEATPQAPVPIEDGAVTTTISRAGSTIDLDSLKLVNNQWGAPADEDLTCAVYHNQGKNFGWYWKRPEPKAKPGINGVLPIYPSLRIGGNPWEQSNSAYFPIRLNAIESSTFQVAYDYPAAPTGIFDLAYDMFFMDTDKSSPNPVIKAEVMIWLQGTIEQSPQTYQGDFSDGLNTYELYSYVMSSGRIYYAYIMKGQTHFKAQHTVDVKKLLDNLDLNPNWYIPGVELGSEVVNGSGKIEISQFSVKVNSLVIEQ
jgi:hypothetical protein